KEMVELLISKGANVNPIVQEGDYKGFTPLMIASQRGNKDIVDLLLSKGADPNIIIKQGYYKNFTALMFANQSGNKELENLLMKNSNSNSINHFNNTRYLLMIDSLKLNMHTIQTAFETYAVDWSGNYPEKLEELIKESKSKSYWRDIKNPFTSMLGIGKNGALMDYKTYKNYKPNPSLKGLVLYEVINPKFDKEYKKSHCVKYKLYGTDENGELLKDKKGEIFFLTNS
ncbi:MAG: ankyrin repeat domain-containing protein, partial [Candidatus Sericytochromatia bacterium]